LLYDNFCVTKIKYILYNVQDYSILYNNSVRQVMRGFAFYSYVECACMAAGRLMSLRGEVWAHKTSFTPPLYYLSACTKTEKWSVMYLCVRVIDFDSFYDFDIRFWNCSDSVVFFVFHFWYLQTFLFIVPSFSSDNLNVYPEPLP